LGWYWTLFSIYSSHPNAWKRALRRRRFVTSGSGSSGSTVYRVPATKIAADEFKKTLAANMVMLGAVTAVTKIVRLESLKMSVREVAPKASRDLNIRALERGFEWAVANLKKP